MYYLYLISSDNRFKIGITKDFKKRNYQYKVHNTNYRFEGIFEVDRKEIEKSIHMSLLKKGYRRCLSYKEWFEGTFSLKDLEKEIKDCLERLRVLGVK